MRKCHFLSITTLLLAAFVFLSSHSIGYTQTLYDGGNVTQVINVYGSVVNYPVPSWFKVGKSFDQSEYFRDQKNPLFIFEQIPKGEKFTKWTSLYAVHALDARKLNISLDQYVNMSIGPFVKACGAENIAISKLHETLRNQTLLLLCQNSPNAPKGSGYGDGIGEVGLFRFNVTKQTYVKVYHEWRGKKFNRADESSWPVNGDVLKEMIERFKLIKITNSP